eukprot:Hpha_TRINITY_DN15438_c1_g1::TRINITY_DN15438_c1_g1_i1::g.172907::m.172907
MRGVFDGTGASRREPPPSWAATPPTGSPPREQQAGWQQQPPPQQWQQPPQQPPQQSPASYQNQGVTFQSYASHHPPPTHPQSSTRQYPASNNQQQFARQAGPPSGMHQGQQMFPPPPSEYPHSGFSSPRSAAAGSMLPTRARNDIPPEHEDPNVFAEEVSRRYLRSGEYDAPAAFLPPFDADAAAVNAASRDAHLRSRGMGGGAVSDAGGMGEGGERGEGGWHRPAQNAIPSGGASGASVYRVGQTRQAEGYATGPAPAWAGPAYGMQ